MKKEDVPQDAGLSDRWQRVAYAVDEKGEYTLVESKGCDSVNITNGQAWELIRDRVAEVRQQVEAGLMSPLAYHMTVFQMDEAILAGYSGFFRWQVRRHLKPAVFDKLPETKLQRYADAFGISISQLKTLPATDALAG